jgi:hypothetical protein
LCHILEDGSMADIRTVDQIATKWATVTPQRTADYEAGVRDPKGDWARATVAAEGAWTGGVQAAIQKKSFTKGVQKAGTSAWQQGSIEKGVPRWGPGVALGQDRYQTGFAPYREAIARTTLPPRFPRRDPRNLERVKAIVAALSAAKEAQGG